MLSQLNANVRQYMLVTFNYWNFTVTDGALRMLVVLYFYDLGYTGLEIASLFLFYEFFGVVTNLIGGWLGARLGLNRTMNIGLGMQIIALLMLAVPASWLSIPWVMGAQALSGIAKDLNKMSAKSAIKTLVPENAQGALYKWIAILTGSKNALKGAGFFLGGALLSLIGFQYAVAAMAGVLLFVFIGSLLFLKSDMGKAKTKPKFSEIFSKSRSVNILLPPACSCLAHATSGLWWLCHLPRCHLWLGSLCSGCISRCLGDWLWHHSGHCATNHWQSVRSAAAGEICHYLGSDFGCGHRFDSVQCATAVAP